MLRILLQNNIVVLLLPIFLYSLNIFKHTVTKAMENRKFLTVLTKIDIGNILICILGKEACNHGREGSVHRQEKKY